MYPFLVAIVFAIVAAVVSVTNTARDLAENLVSHSDQITVDFYAYRKAVQRKLCSQGLSIGVIPDDELTAELGKTINGTYWHHYIANGNIFFYIEDTDANRQISAGLTDRTDVSVAMALDSDRAVHLLNGDASGITVPDAVPANTVVVVSTISQNCLIDTSSEGTATLSDGTLLDLCGHKLTTSDGHIITYDSNQIGIDGYTVTEGQVTSDGIRVAKNGEVFTQSHSIRIEESGLTVDGIRYAWTEGENCVTKPSTSLPETSGGDDGKDPETPEGGENGSDAGNQPSGDDTESPCVDCGTALDTGDGGGDDGEPDTPLDDEDVCEDEKGGVWDSSAGTCTLQMEKTGSESMQIKYQVGGNNSTYYILQPGSVNFGVTYSSPPALTGTFTLPNGTAVPISSVATVTTTGFSWSTRNLGFMYGGNVGMNGVIYQSTLNWTAEGEVIE